MKLYYTPGTCSLAPHIVLREAGLDANFEKVDLGTKKTESGEDFTAINGKGYVPTLQLDDGHRLTEVAAILQYLVALAPQRKLAPQVASRRWYQMLEWLTFISSELHKSFSPLFRPEVPEEVKQMQRQLLSRRLEHVATALGDEAYVLGDTYSVADAYLFTVLSWAQWVQFDLSRWPVLEEYRVRISARPAVQAALRAEGLMQ